MAPDLNGVSSGERWDYSTPGSSGYKVPNIAWHDPATRKIKVVCIGGGVSGILNAYNIQKYCQNVDLKVFEKNSEVGGTWLENRYPGCACDIPSHAYTYNFALNPDWPRFMSYSDDIWKYLEKVCNVFGLKRYIQFNSRVAGCWWQEDEGEWLVRVEKLDGAGQVADTIEERAHVLLYASGILNNWKWPDIEGLHDFRGRLVHTAHWPPDYQEGQWKNDTVGVIGSGASSIQTVPNMQPFVKHMDVFVRTAVWFTQIAENYGQNHEYSDEEKTKFREDPNALVEHAKYFEDRVNGVWGGFLNGTKASDDLKKLFRERMKEHIKDERLLQGFTPQFGVGCRRITPGDPYMKAIQEPNVDVHFTHATRVTADGIVGADGIERKCDTVVCATGFDVSYRPRFPLVGRGGIDLRDQWKDDPQGYLGLAVPRYPNLVWFVGPAWPAENGSAIGPLQGVGEYAIQMIRKLQFENIHSLDPKQDATDDYNKHTQEWIKHTVWKEDCRSWYKNNETGKVNAIYPGSSMHYLMAIRHPRWEDYEIKYRSVDGFAGMDGKPAFGTNRFGWLGAGHTMHTQEEGRAAGLDPSPYLQAQFLEPEWLVACGYSKEQAREIVLDAAAAAARKEKARLLDLEGRGEGGSVLRDNGAKSL